MMTSNTLTASANTAGSLFQIFNLPKAGNSSYLFSDIIKIIGNEADPQTINNLPGITASSTAGTAVPELNIIDTSKLIGLLLKNINGETGKNAETNENLSGEQFYISENDLNDFITLLGLEKTSAVAQQLSEIEVEISPEFLEKLARFTGGSVKDNGKHLFISLDNSINDENKDDSEVIPSGNKKIKIIFKKIEQDNSLNSLQPELLAGDFNYKIIHTLETTGAVNPGLTAEPEKTIVVSPNAQANGSTKVSAKGQGVDQKIQVQTGNIEFELTSGEDEISTVKNSTDIAAKPVSDSQELTGNKLPVDKKPVFNVGSNIKIENPDKEITQVNTKSNNKAEPVINVSTEDSSDTDVMTAQKISIKSEMTEPAGEKIKVNMQESHTKLVIKPLPDKTGTESAEKISGRQDTKISLTLPGKEPVEGLQKTSVENTSTKNVSVENSSTKNVSVENSSDKTAPKTVEKVFSRPLIPNEILKGEEDIKTPGTTAKTVSELKSLYQVTFEKAEPKNPINNEKSLPHNFYTSDYEEFDNGLFTDKLQAVVKEKVIQGKPEEHSTNQATSSAKDGLPENKITVKESPGDSQDKSASNNNSGENHQGNKQNMKPGNEFILEPVQSRNASNDSASTGKTEPVKDYTLFKNINANDLIDEVKSLVVKGERSNVVLKLNPGHLGSVKLIIEIKDAVMNTKIEVENESVRQIVQNNVDILKQSLQQNGIHLNSFTVSLTSQEQKSSSAKPEHKKKGHTVKNDITIDEEINASASKKMGYNTYEYLA
ncbi:MAG: flagellar hook-length control protein FliK [Ignavibacteriaceae bacterium]